MNIVQDQLDKAYAEDGLTDEILDLQLKLNKLRAESNISEKDEFLQ